MYNVYLTTKNWVKEKRIKRISGFKRNATKWATFHFASAFSLLCLVWSSSHKVFLGFALSSRSWSQTHPRHVVMQASHVLFTWRHSAWLLNRPSTDISTGVEKSRWVQKVHCRSLFCRISTTIVIISVESLNLLFLSLWVMCPQQTFKL